MDSIHFFDNDRTIFSILANNMRYLREFFGWRRDDLAKELGWTTQKLTNFELGLAEPDVKELVHFAKFFQAVPEDIISESKMRYRPDTHEEREMAQTSNNSPKTLSEMIAQTEGIQKILDGFLTFYALQMEEKEETSSSTPQWHARFQETINLLKDYLTLNHKIIAAARH